MDKLGLTSGLRGYPIFRQSHGYGSRVLSSNQGTTSLLSKFKLSQISKTFNLRKRNQSFQLEMGIHEKYGKRSKTIFYMLLLFLFFRILWQW